VLAISAFDMALWDLKAKRARLPLWNLLGGFDARVPCYAGGIDLDLTLDKLLRQTDDNLAKGFRAVKMKVGRKRLAEDIERVKAMRAHLGEGFPLMVDANMKWKDLGVLKARKDAAETIGDPVPQDIELHSLPPEVANKVQQARSHSFFIKEGDNAIVLVSPTDRRVADVIR
jgi:L-alanine-DL-glutamate epimerase-like enolase superfamily enzyme